MAKWRIVFGDNFVIVARDGRANLEDSMGREDTKPHFFFLFVVQLFLYSETRNILDFHHKTIKNIYHIITKSL